MSCAGPTCSTRRLVSSGSTSCSSWRPVPGYAHVPLLLGPDGQRLAKRHGAVGLAELRARGADPAALVGWLAHSAGLLERPEPCAPGDLVEHFDPAALRREPSRVDPGELRW